MTLDVAIRLTELLLGIVFIQQSAEHLVAARSEKILFSIRICLSLALCAGFAAQWVLLALVILSLFILHRFQGPYNGGSDRMGLLVLSCLTLAHFMPNLHAQELVFGYLGIQLILSYFISGWVKIINPEWRKGSALNDVFRYSVYPVSEHLRALIQWPKLLFVMSWAVMLFELLFPFMLLSQYMLVVGLSIAALFHLANAYIFGLNRFFWIWLTAYPALIWLQTRIFTGSVF